MNGHLNKAQILAKILCCPNCYSALEWNHQRCLGCDFAFFVHGEKFSFLPQSNSLSQDDFLNSLKEKIRKSCPDVYRLILNILAPVYSHFSVSKFLQKFKSLEVKLNLGAGVTQLASDLINVDLIGYKNIDVITCLEKLPFRCESVDLIVNIAVLEHIANPSQVVSEFLRVLKPQGLALVFVPFMQGFHAAPNDFQRYTKEGLKILFKDFEILELIPIGPTSSLVWILQEWLALVFSFGFRPLYRLLYLLSLFLSPLKYFDMVLGRHPMASQIASGHYVILRKHAR